MKVSVEIKIKTKSGKEVVLDSADARELFMELKKFYEKEKEYVPSPYPVYPYRPYYPYNPPYYVWTSKSGTTAVTYTGGQVVSSSTVMIGG